MVKNNGKSKLKYEVEKAFNRDCHVRITLCNNHEHALNYLLGYVIQDTSNYNPKKLAEHIVRIYKHHLVERGGYFRKRDGSYIRIIKQFRKCDCGGNITFTLLDFGIENDSSYILYQNPNNSSLNKKSPPNTYYNKPKISFNTIKRNQTLN